MAANPRQEGKGMTPRPTARRRFSRTAYPSASPSGATTSPRDAPLSRSIST